MPSTFTLETNAIPAAAPVRRPKLDFDQNGQKSSLQELFLLGGLFPLARIQDRLPFSRYRIGVMAKAWKGEPSEWLVCAQPKAQRGITLIDLELFSEAFDAHTETPTTSDLRAAGFPLDLDEGSEMLLLGQNLRGVQGATSPA